MPKPLASRKSAKQLATYTAREGLATQGKPHYLHYVTDGVYLGYRRNATTAGTWVVRVNDGMQPEWTKTIGLADDAEPADGERVLSFTQADAKARQIVNGDGAVASSMTLDQALVRYEKALAKEGTPTYNARHCRCHLTPALLAQQIAMVTVDELERWRDGLKLSNVTYNRMKKGILTAVKQAVPAALPVWEQGLPSLAAVTKGENAGRRGGARNVILTDAKVRAFVSEAYKAGAELGLLMHVLAETGTRPAQAALITVANLLDGATPKLKIPKSMKGGRKAAKRVEKAAEFTTVPISASLAARLRQAAGDRADDERLLLQANGRAWDYRKPKEGRPNHPRPPHYYYRRIVDVAVVAIGEDPKRVTPYAFRHSSIVRMLKLNKPIRLVAVMHDTSVKMIEAHYSRYIDDHADEILRGAVLEVENVVTLVTAA